MTGYVAYGVRLDSDVILPGLPRPRGDERTTVTAMLERTPPSGARRDRPADAEYLVDGRPLSLRVGEDLEIDWRNVCSFRVSIGNSLIRCTRGREGSDEHVREWLLHYVLPLLLHGENRLQFLHGSAVEIDGRAVGFLAPSGGGKTTLADYFMRRGHALFTDEKLGFAARGERFVAVPSTPFLRRDAEPAQWEPVTTFAASSMPLGTLYLLSPTDAAADPAIASVPASEATFALAGHCEFQLPPSVRKRLRMPPFRAQCFQSCAALAAALPVNTLAVPRDRSRLSEVYDAVVADLARAA